jgi:hypothetical protein
MITYADKVRLGSRDVSRLETLCGCKLPAFRTVSELNTFIDQQVARCPLRTAEDRLLAFVLSALKAPVG